MTRSERLLALLQTLRRYRYPVSGAALAQELGISIRTLYRDIASLQAQGADIEGEPGVGYVLRPGFMLPPLMFSQSELEALMLGFRWVAKFADKPITIAASNALAKISAVLPEELRNELGNETLLVGPRTIVAVNARNIGLNEYEGHCLYDMVYGNKTDIDISSVTGNNHSLNKLNFVALDSIDVNYVPSIKNVRAASEELYSSVPIEHDHGPLRPVGMIKVDLIESQSRTIQRVLLSLLLQENTQSHLIRKLNSHVRYTRLRVALYEYNKIFKSTHVLNLIEDMNLRRAIRAARNHTEAYHQLQSLIRKVYSSGLNGRKISDNRISAHATRLVANCIVAYNVLILNTVYEKTLAEGVSKKILDEFARISPLAWHHLFFTGRYSFKNAGKTTINVAAMAAIGILISVVKQFDFSSSGRTRNLFFRLGGNDNDDSGHVHSMRCNTPRYYTLPITASLKFSKSLNTTAFPWLKFVLNPAITGYSWLNIAKEKQNGRHQFPWDRFRIRHHRHY